MIRGLLSKRASTMWLLSSQTQQFVAARSSARCLSAAAPRFPAASGLMNSPTAASQHPHRLPDVRLGFACAAAASSSGTRVAAAAASAATTPGDDATKSRIAQLLGIRLPSYCSGCGVKLQQTDPDGPGYFQVPRRLIEMAEEQAAVLAGSSGQQQQPQVVTAEERERRSIDAALEAWLDEQQRPAVPNLGGSSSSASSAGNEASASSSSSSSSGGTARQANVKCARCYSLVHYGKVKSEAAEGVLPAFDLAKKVGRKISLQKDRKATVLCVVDVADFDGSLPRTALASLFPGIGPDGSLPKDPNDLPFDLAVAVNKFDLLPPQATQQRVQQWVRTRLKQAGLPRPNRVFMVSAINGVGVKEMLKTLRGDMGFRADLWVVGAQNAGKSSLIAAMRRLGGVTGSSSSSGPESAGISSSTSSASGDPTIAPIPGTTLGLLQVSGVPLGPKHRVFDTPGVPHPYQLTSRLNLRELAAVLPRRRLKPRTYCIPIGNSILIGGLARIDAVSGPSSNMYVTIFVSDEIVTHMGKTVGAEERLQKHVGGLLVPPYEAERLQELRLVPRTAVVEGSSWKEHSRDIAIAGLGWVAVGVSGTAELKVWVPEGVSVTLHDALIPDYAKVWQKPGFSAMLPQAAKKGAAGKKGAKGGGGKKASSSSSGSGSGSDSDSE